MGEFDNSVLFRQLFGTGDGQIFTGTMAECSQQQWMVNVCDGLSSRDQSALQNRQDYNNQLDGLSNVSAQQQYQSRGNQFVPTTIELNCEPGTVVHKEPKPRKRHWLLSWIPKSDPVVGRDFHPKKTLTEAEKAYWGV